MNTSLVGVATQFPDSHQFSPDIFNPTEEFISSFSSSPSQNCGSEKESRTCWHLYPTIAYYIIQHSYYIINCVVITNRFPSFIKKKMIFKEQTFIRFIFGLGCFGHKHYFLSTPVYIWVLQSSIRRCINYAFLVFLENYFASIKFEVQIHTLGEKMAGKWKLYLWMKSR